jgi:hypothetical protein
MTRFGISLATAGVLLLATVAVAGTQRRNRGDNSIHGTPVATNTILKSPDAYDGKLVTVSAAVEEVLSRTVFVIDQRKAEGGTVKAVGQPILVIAPTLSGTIAENNYLMVRGEVVKFDADAIARAEAGYTLDLAPEVAAKYSGQPVLLATSVIDSKYAELAKPPVGPKPPETR